MKYLVDVATRVSAAIASRGPDTLSVTTRYSIALALIVIATAVRLLLAPQEAGLPYVTYFPAATLTAIFGGPAPAALATVLGTLTAGFLFIPPFNALSFKPEAWSSALVFCIDEVLVCSAIEAMRYYYRKSLDSAALLEQAHVAERQARMAAERANEAKSRFLAAASHDLRQPYQALRLFHAALQPDELPPATKAAILEKMELAMSAGEELLRSLLDLSTLEAGVIIPQWSDVDIAEMMAAIDTSHRGPAEGKGLSFRIHKIAGTIRTDPVLLRRILDNLIANAISYTPSGGILVAARRRADGVAVEVWDTGVGIAPEHQTIIFEEFYQICNAERDRGKGTGIGLAVAAKTANLIGCDLQLTSRLGQGTCFRVVIHRAEAIPAQTVSAAS